MITEECRNENGEQINDRERESETETEKQTPTPKKSIFGNFHVFFIRFFRFKSFLEGLFGEESMQRG